MQKKREGQPSESMALGALLTLAGGFQDAYSYNGRGHVFANAQTGNVVLLGQNLAADIIDTCHMLSRKPTEIMSQGHAGPGMRIVVLNHVADILHSVRLAPGAKLSGKAFLTSRVTRSM